MDMLLGWFWPEWTMLGVTTYVILGMVRMYLIFVLGFKLKAKGTSKIIVAPLFIYGFIYDIFLNYLITVPTKDLPRAWDETITNRMKRYKKDEPTSWKGTFSFWMCEKLSKYDKGHC